MGPGVGVGSGGVKLCCCLVCGCFLCEWMCMYKQSICFRLVAKACRDVSHMFRETG